MHYHMTSTHIAESAHTRNRAIVTRPFSLAEGWGLGTRLVYIWCMYNTRIQYRRPLPYRADRSARYGKDCLYCMQMHIISIIIANYLYSSAVKNCSYIAIGEFLLVICNIFSA